MLSIIRHKFVTFKVSWTLALREIVLNCYRYHGREDLLPQFHDEEETKETREKINQKQAQMEEGEVVREIHFNFAVKKLSEPINVISQKNISG